MGTVAQGTRDGDVSQRTAVGLGGGGRCIWLFG